jgi:ribosome-binding factor A
VGGQIQRELAQIIQQELRDPRVGLVTISAVEMSKDMGHAKVFITLMNPDQDVAETIKVLKKASGFLRRALGKRIMLRVLPELHFVYDSSLVEGLRVSALLDAVAAERKEHEE